MNTSKLTKRQVKKSTKEITVNGKPARIDIVLRYDDECSNGHNSFSMTGTLWSNRTGTTDRSMITCGAIKEEISKYAPELDYLAKWHLTSSDEPMHYIANTVYWAKEGNLDYARSSAVWEDGTIEELSNEDILKERLPKLMKEFKSDMEKAGFVF